MTSGETNLSVTVRRGWCGGGGGVVVVVVVVEEDLSPESEASWSGPPSLQCAFSLSSVQLTSTPSPPCSSG
ncbi:hypothetical protein E2C01_068283 [Portunus trituberculatus]|uniref:Uncharacterized protein n=1 Tax=Portunus trituberculatus TaxID=210409 RepID=A0A5B7HNG2_PORTR|nr:hypothetical protein [Portunus trituberculatus]